MTTTTNRLHPQGEEKMFDQQDNSRSVEVETYDGKLFIEWDPQATVTPLG